MSDSSSKDLPYLDLTIEFPESVEFWDFDRNSFPPNKIPALTWGKEYRYPKSFLKCKLGHSFSRKTTKLVKDSFNCKTCSGTVLLSGFNDLETLRPDLLRDWDYELNTIDPSQVRVLDSKKYFWKCSKRLHDSYLLGVAYKSQKDIDTCSVCRGYIFVSGTNDLATTHPDLMKEWSPRNTIDPTQINRGSKEFVEWICPLDKRHVWKSRIADKAINGIKCAVCSNHQIILGVNDAATVKPHLVDEWHPELNDDDKLCNYSRGYNATRHWWKCKKKGHTWLATILDRGRGSGCPKCPFHTARSEREVIAAISHFYDGEIELCHRGVIGRKELDIFFPDLMLGIEFNGEYWHDEVKHPKAKKRHQAKQAACKEMGVGLFVLWEREWIESRDETLKDIDVFLKTRKVLPKHTYDARRKT